MEHPGGLKAHALSNRTRYKARGKGAQLFAWRKAHWANWVLMWHPLTRMPVESFSSRVVAGRAHAAAQVNWFLSNVAEELDARVGVLRRQKAQRLYAVAPNAMAMRRRQEGSLLPFPPPTIPS